MKKESTKVVTLEEYLKQENSVDKTAMDIYIETAIDELTSNAIDKIEKYSYGYDSQSLFSYDDAILTLHFKEGVLNDSLGEPRSSLSFSSYDIAQKEHIACTQMKYFVGTDEHNARIRPKKTKKSSERLYCPIHKTESNSFYIKGYELYRACKPCDSFDFWIDEELKSFQEGIDYVVADSEECGRLLFILTLPTAITIVSTTEDFSWSDKYREGLVNQLQSKLMDSYH